DVARSTDVDGDDLACRRGKGVERGDVEDGVATAHCRGHGLRIAQVSAYDLHFAAFRQVRRGAGAEKQPDLRSPVEKSARDRAADEPARAGDERPQARASVAPSMGRSRCSATSSAAAAARARVARRTSSAAARGPESAYLIAGPTYPAVGSRVKAGRDD